MNAIGIFLPDNETLRWMKSLITADAPWYLASLRSGLRRVCSRGKKLDEALVREVLERIVSLGTTPGFEHFEDADGLLLGSDDDRGLLQTQPSIALNFLFDWQEQATAEEREDRMRRRQGLSEFGQLEPTIEEDEDDDE